MSAQKNAVHGWIVLNKPVGASSAKAVAVVRRYLGGAKTGHAGTLDPLACGVLPIAVGEATKTISYVMTAEKSYRFTLRWGAETQTGDTEGEVTKTSNHRPSAEDITAVLPRFTGLITQVPPVFSAVKIKGRRAYALARDSQRGGQDTADLDLPPRQVMIQSLTMTDHTDEETTFSVRCGKGTYIRSLARDIGRALGSAAHVVFLERRSVGRFDIDQAISLDFFDQMVYTPRAHDYVIPVMTALDDIPALAITEQEAEKLRFGQSVTLDPTRAEAFRAIAGDAQQDPVTGVAACDQQPVAIVKLMQQILSPVRVLNI